MNIEKTLLDPARPDDPVRGTVSRAGFGSFQITTAFGTLVFNSDGCWPVLTEEEVRAKQKKN